MKIINVTDITESEKAKDLAYTDIWARTLEITKISSLNAESTIVLSISNSEKPNKVENQLGSDDDTLSLLAFAEQFKAEFQAGLPFEEILAMDVTNILGVENKFSALDNRGGLTK